ncbi:MAG: type II toxin-antitoxin system RelE/ParE family toxin [Chloroflexi bacterium]|nr:type II toxin-antitoxin system RelE/ParE family toxin [Chloroflexota bacterium]
MSGEQRMKEPSSNWQIEFYTDSHNNSPVINFLNTLTAEEKVKIRNQLRLLREFGVRLGMPQARPLKGHKPLWELRPMPNRLIYVAMRGKRFVILHAFTKKSQKTPPKGNQNCGKTLSAVAR